jgi:hypothetical protein
MGNTVLQRGFRPFVRKLKDRLGVHDQRRRAAIQRTVPEALETIPHHNRPEPSQALPEIRDTGFGNSNKVRVGIPVLRGNASAEDTLPHLRQLPQLPPRSRHPDNKFRCVTSIIVW